MGFKTAVWISNYSVFSEEMNEWGLDELRTYFKARWKRSRKVEKRLLYRSLLDYVSLGRKPMFGLIDSSTIKSLLDDGFLVICPVHVSTFRRRSGRDKGHFVLLTGYGADEFFVNDPYLHAKGRITIRHEHLLASLFKLKDPSIVGVKG